MNKKEQDKTIKLTVYFYTNDLPSKRQAWNEGVVNIRTNRLHGIRATDTTQKQFDGIDNVTDAIKQVLKSAGVSLFKEDKEKRKILVEY